MTSTRDALALLRSANPVPVDGAPSLAAPGPMPPGLAAPTPAAPRPIRSRRSTRIGLLVGATAGVAALALGVGLLPLPGSHGAASPAAADALDRAATAADITARDEAADPDQYWRIRTVGTYLASAAVESSAANSDTPPPAWLSRTTRTEYVSVDGSRPSWFVDSAPEVVEVFAGDAPALERKGESWTTDLAPNDQPASWQTPTPAWLAELPRDTDALRDRLYADTAGHGRSHDGEVLVYVADVLRTGMVPADLRAALFRVLETVPGVEVVRRHDDGLISIGRLESVDGERQEIVIDPATGAYAGEQSVATQGIGELGIPAGTVVEDASVTTTVVDTVPAKVRADARRCTTSEDGAITCQ